MVKITVWLVIQIGILGEPLITVEDSKQPDIDTCLARAADVLKKAATISEGYDEMFTQCSIVKQPADPA